MTNYVQFSTSAYTQILSDVPVLFDGLILYVFRLIPVLFGFFVILFACRILLRLIRGAR